MTTRALLWLAGVAAAQLAVGAQQPQTPVYRSGVDVIAVDVHVVDRAGHPVVGLRPDEFSVSVDGKPRAVESVDFVSYVGDSSLVASDATNLRPLFSTNLTPTRTIPPRTVMLVVDEDNIRAGAARWAAIAAERFLDRAQPTDLIGFVTIPAGKTGIDPTTDRAPVRSALQRIIGHLTPADVLGTHSTHALAVSEAFAYLHDRERPDSAWRQVLRRECSPIASQILLKCPEEMAGYAQEVIADVRQRATGTIRALSGLLDGLASVPGPKTFILISQELPVSAYPSEQHAFFSEAAPITAAAARAQATVYVLHLDAPLVDVATQTASPNGPADADMRAYGLETVTSLTGGRRWMVSGSAEPAFERIALEISGYYLIGLRAEPGDRDGRPHAIKVEVKRQGVEVRARKAFSFSSPAGESAAKNASDVVKDLLRTADAATALPISVATYTLPAAPDAASASANRARAGVLITAEIDRGRTAPADVTVGYALIDDAGRNAGASVEALTLRPAIEHPDGPLCYLGVALVPPGDYTLRLAAADAGLRSGSVAHRVAARPLEAGGYSLGDLIVLDPHRAEADKPRPSTTGVVATPFEAYFEARASAADLPPLVARLEIGKSQDAPPLVSSEMHAQPSGERVLVNGMLSLAGVPEGDYLARAVVSAGGEVLARLARPVRIVKETAAKPPAPRLSSAVPSTAEPPASNADELVERARGWLLRYAEELSIVIGVERYAQYMGGEGFSRAYGRQFVSEFALVRTKDDWLGFRDVFEIDGKPVPDRQDRLRRLFLDAPDSAVVQARRISDESARYNLGAIQRNFNVPTMALFFLHPTNAGRFQFRKVGEERIDGHHVWKVRYQETRAPTIIRTSAGKDMPVAGEFWIDANSGAVLKTHMQLEVEAAMGGTRAPSSPWDMDSGTPVRRVRSSASVTVTYKEDGKLGLLVPDRMLETYEGPSVNRFTGNEEISKVNCSATYSGFRRFETSGRVVVPK